jgi:hypothetical protein
MSDRVCCPAAAGRPVQQGLYGGLRVPLSPRNSARRRLHCLGRSSIARFRPLAGPPSSHAIASSRPAPPPFNQQPDRHPATSSPVSTNGMLLLPSPSSWRQQAAARSCSHDKRCLGTARLRPRGAVAGLNSRSGHAAACSAAATRDASRRAALDMARRTCLEPLAPSGAGDDDSRHQKIIDFTSHVAVSFLAPSGRARLRRLCCERLEPGGAVLVLMLTFS